MVVHVKPCSTLHRCEHPSPSATLPSSQSSPASRFPFPQLVAQAWVVEPVRQTGSLVQVFEHPVPSPLKRPFGPVQPVGKGDVLLVPQSQDSLVSTMPLPQTELTPPLPAAPFVPATPVPPAPDMPAAPVPAAPVVPEVPPAPAPA